MRSKKTTEVRSSLSTRRRPTFRRPLTRLSTTTPTTNQTELTTKTPFNKKFERRKYTPRATTPKQLTTATSKTPSEPPAQVKATNRFKFTPRTRPTLKPSAFTPKPVAAKDQSIESTNTNEENSEAISGNHLDIDNSLKVIGLDRKTEPILENFVNEDVVTIRHRTNPRPTVSTASPPVSTTKIRRTKPKTPAPFDKIKKTDDASFTYRSVVDYDYYDEGDVQVVLKGPIKGKVVIHPSGRIQCLDQGNFPHPISCKKFISCAKMQETGQVIGWEYTCPKNLSFDPVGGICNWSAGLGCKENV